VGDTRCSGRRGGVADREPPPKSAAARRSFSARAAASSSDSARRRDGGCGGGAPAAGWLETLLLPAADAATQLVQMPSSELSNFGDKVTA
jgi:hypothetical protein